MKLEGKVVVVTGGGRGIGRAMVRRFAAERAKVIVVADRDLEAAERVAAELSGGPARVLARGCDVTREEEVARLITRTRQEEGGLHLFCSNAGTGAGKGLSASVADWQRLWDVNVMSTVHAARALLQGAWEKEDLYLLVTASAAGLLSMVGDAAYSATKHAAVALAEWLSITYGAKGLKVSCLCPQFVNTDLLAGALKEAGGGSIAKAGPVLEPEQVAEAVVAGLAAERFLILPHPEVTTYEQRRAADHDRWIAGMRKLQAEQGH